MAQKFMTYDQQLNKLQTDKGLTIPDAVFARKTLEEISYYSLIGGYKELFLHPASKKYKYGVTFNEIVAFYHFDEQLRNIFLKYILQVERHLKSIISYHFTEKYGESQNEYLNPLNFDYLHHQKQVKRLINSLNQTISQPSHYRYITHHFNKYLISDTKFKTFRRNLAFIIKDVLKKCPHLTEDQLLKEMGFPNNWANIARYKK